MNVFLLPTSTAGTGHWIQEMNRNQGKIKSSSSLPQSECAGEHQSCFILNILTKYLSSWKFRCSFTTADESCILKGEPAS